MKKKKIFPFVVCFLVLGILFSFWKLKIFDVDKVLVDIKNASCVADSQIKSENNLLGKNIFFIDENKIKKDILNKFPCIGMVKIEKQFPKTVKLNLEGRIPFVRLDTYNNDNLNSLADMESSPSSATAFLNWSFPVISSNPLFVADNNGNIFETVGESGLPIIYLQQQKLEIGQALGRSLFNNLNKIFSNIKNLEFPTPTKPLKEEDDNSTSSARLIVEDDILIPRAKIEGNYLLVKNPQKLAFSLSSDIMRQLASLQLILQKAKIEGKTMELIDLRFDNPVVIYNDGKR